MLDEIRTFIAVAEAGSLQKAAARVFRTPSAATRQIQRLETVLGTVLLDRSVKPLRLTAAGRSVLEGSRELLSAYERLRGSAGPRAEPAGPFRLGLAHALADPAIIAPVLRVTRRFPGLQPQFSSDATPSLLARVRNADLDAALVILPEGGPVPADLPGALLATDRYALVRARGAAGKRGRLAQLDRPWIVNPKGCLIREALRLHLEREGLTMRIGAEMHNVELQLSLVASGAGLGVVPHRMLSRLHRRTRLERLRQPDWDLSVSIGLVHAAHLAHLEAAAQALAANLAAHFAGRSATQRPARSPRS